MGKHKHAEKQGHSHQHNLNQSPSQVIIIRPNSGISGDILLAGLSTLAGISDRHLDEMIRQLGFDHLDGSLKLHRRMVDNVMGVALKVELPHEHEHRCLKDIETILNNSGMTEPAKKLALNTFRLLAEAEAMVHDCQPEQIHFHEVGALDSILDIALCAMILTQIGAEHIYCGPLPICDGVIKCAHGLMPSPAPAVMHLLEGIPVKGLASEGETVTPTGVAFLKAAETIFGHWPNVTIKSHAIAYGTRYFPSVPNGVVFALGYENNASRRHNDHDCCC